MKFLANHLPIIIDIEASGFGAGSYPIEIGLALSNGGRLCQLIKPASDWQHWDLAAQDVHKINPDILVERGHEIISVANWLNDLLVGKTVYSNAWGHDSSWLGKLFYAAEKTQLFQMDSVVSLLTEENELELWQSCMDQVLKEFKGQRHRASVDAAIIQRCYELTKLKSKNMGCVAS